MKKVSNGFIYTFGALGGLLFGYDIASVSGAILFIQKQLHLNSWQQGWVVSSVLIGATLGALGTSKFLDKYGRRKLLIWASIIFAIGALGSGCTRVLDFTGDADHLRDRGWGHLSLDSSLSARIGA